nr:hypothetical protein BgiMline_010123 [Biomphalaria glabrata]
MKHCTFLSFVTLIALATVTYGLPKQVLNRNCFNAMSCSDDPCLMSDCPVRCVHTCDCGYICAPQFGFAIP